MFRSTLSCAIVAAVSEAAMNFKSQTNGLLQPLNFAQTSNGCCCTVMPCMPSCQDMCQPKEVVIPEPLYVAAPQPVRDVVFNLDVILTTLLHQQGPEIELPFVPDSPDEVNFINNVAVPITIQLINNDIMPAIPTCTFPQGQGPEDYGLAEGSFINGGTTEAALAAESNMPDPIEVARNAILLALENTSLPDGIDIGAMVDSALEPAQGILLQSDMTAEDVGMEITTIISGLETTINNWTASISSAEQQAYEAAGGDSSDLNLMDNLQGDFL